MTTTKEVLTETREGVEYELSATKTGKPSKCVGLAPTKIPQGETFDDKLEWLTNEYGSEAIVKCFARQNVQDAMNNVRAKYNKDKVTASAVIKAVNDGLVSPEEYAAAWADVKRENNPTGKFENLTTAICTLYLGTGEDALKNADPAHIHWDCAR